MEPNTLPDPSTLPNSASNELADDLLRGADEIAEFIFGARGSRRKVYSLAETSHLPVFRLGAMLCARLSACSVGCRREESRVRPPRQ